MTPLENIKTIYFLLFENRSFDHLLGHLSLPPFNTPALEGLKGTLVNGTLSDNPAYGNFVGDELFFPFHLTDRVLPSDLPHERGQISVQLAPSTVTGDFTMQGFMKAYFAMTPANRPALPAPMGFFTADEVPVSNFLARSFAVCDHWFAPLPADTQPNRLMAWSGYSRLEKCVNGLMPQQTLVLDWLNAHQVRWRVYHAGISFFALMGRFGDIFGPNFKNIDQLQKDVLDEDAETFPQVVFIEPSYGDAPIHIGESANDSHPPAPIGPGEKYLAEVYGSVTASPDRWRTSVLIVTYDEHGGFFDHLPPARVSMPPPPDALYETGFATTGPRVPALVASPWVKPGAVASQLLDHTSVLQLIAERFGDGKPYSPSVASRAVQGVQSASTVLTLTSPRLDVPSLARHPILASWKPPVPSPASASPSTNAAAFRTASQEWLSSNVVAANASFPELANWSTHGG
jgi:phospholipase C